MPAAGSTRVSKNESGLHNEVEPRVDPSGLRIATAPLVELHELVPPMVEPVRVRLTCWLALPVKVSRAFWPGVEIVTGTEGPPGLIVPVTSTAWYTVTVADPV